MGGDPVGSRCLLASYGIVDVEGSVLLPDTEGNLERGLVFVVQLGRELLTDEQCSGVRH